MIKPTTEGTVIKVTEQYIVLLCENGSFKNIPRSPRDFPMMGEKIKYTEKQKRSNIYASWLKYASIASAAMMVLITFSLLQMGNSQAAYIVAIDINPSIELYADKDLIVKKIKTLNKDGEILMLSIDFKNQPLLKIVEEMIDQSVAEGYLTAAENALITTTIVSAEPSEAEAIANFHSAIKRNLYSHHIEAEVTIAQANLKVFEEAKKLNLSVNKYVIYTRMTNEGLSINMEEMKTQSIAALLQKEAKEKNKLDNKEKPLNGHDQAMPTPKPSEVMPLNKLETPSKSKPESINGNKPKKNEEELTTEDKQDNRGQLNESDETGVKSDQTAIPNLAEPKMNKSMPNSNQDSDEEGNEMKTEPDPEPDPKREPEPEPKNEPDSNTTNQEQVQPTSLPEGQIQHETTREEEPARKPGS